MTPNKLAVVTGAGQGMGHKIALRLARGGFHVILVGRTESKLEAVAAEINAQGEQATLFTADLTNSHQLQPLAEQIQALGGSLDALVNSAGEAFVATLEQTSEADWDRLLAVNLKAPFLTTRLLLPFLRQSANASIVNIASKVALKGYQPVSAYTAAKTGLLGFSRALAAELRADEIRVVALCPGPVDTPMRWSATPHFERKLVISAETIADTVWYLVNLPKGVTAGEIVLQSIHYD